jgi:hypothetical protein
VLPDGSSETGVPHWGPIRSLTRPPLIRWGHTGRGGETVPTIARIDRSLPAQLLPCSRGGGGAEENIKSATEVTPSSEVIKGRKRRGSVSSPRHDTMHTVPIEIAVVPPRGVSGKSRRASPQSPRQSKLKPSERATIRAIGNNRTLRFGR